jgi:hypothetical protein
MKNRLLLALFVFPLLVTTCSVEQNPTIPPAVDTEAPASPLPSPTLTVPAPTITVELPGAEGTVDAFLDQPCHSGDH